MSDERFAQFKLVLLGESAVGKLSIVHRFVKNTFDNMRESTIGAAFLTQLVTLPDTNTTVKFEIWDTAGQERYKSLAPMYYRNANAALCVYDVTSRASFAKAQEWIKELQKQAPEGIVIGLVGNKVDLDERDVETSEVAQYVDELNEAGGKVITAECLAKTGEGVLETFAAIAKALPVEEAQAARSRVLRNKRSGVDLSRRQALQPQSLGCC